VRFVATGLVKVLRAWGGGDKVSLTFYKNIENWAGGIGKVLV
jgi:hypothetical protein